MAGGIGNAMKWRWQSAESRTSPERRSFLSEWSSSATSPAASVPNTAPTRADARWDLLSNGRIETRRAPYCCEEVIQMNSS